MQFYLNANLVTFVFFVSSMSYALDFMKPEDCTTKRLDKPPGVASKLPIYAQTGSECVAYATAQLVDCWRFTNAPPVTQLTSPLALAYEQAAITGRSDTNKFESLEILNNINKLKSCSYDVVKDQFNGKGAADFFFEIEMAHKFAKSNPANLDKATANTLNCMIKYNIPNAASINAETIKGLLQENSKVQFVDKLLEKICANKTIPLSMVPAPPKVVRVSDFGNQQAGMEKVRDTINKHLNNENAQPLGISFCRDVFHNRDITSVNESGYRIPGVCKEPHSAIVVGRRLVKFKDGNKTGSACQFLIRDSNGSSCNAYKNDPTTTPSEVCENGQVWVDEDALLINTDHVHYIGK